MQSREGGETRFKANLMIWSFHLFQCSFSFLHFAPVKAQTSLSLRSVYLSSQFLLLLLSVKSQQPRSKPKDPHPTMQIKMRKMCESNNTRTLINVVAFKIHIIHLWNDLLRYKTISIKYAQAELSCVPGQRSPH